MSEIDAYPGDKRFLMLMREEIKRECGTCYIRDTKSLDVHDFSNLINAVKGK